MAPTARSSGSSWVAPTAIAGVIALLVMVGLIAGIRAVRHREDTTPAPSAVLPPPPPPPLALVAAPTTMVEPEPDAEPAPIVAPPPPPPDSCRIAWWRGYVRSRFYAYEGNGDGETRLVAESPLFSWRSNEPPTENPAALAAYTKLVEALEQLGWEPDGSGDTWFGAHFRRAVTGTPHVTA